MNGNLATYEKGSVDIAIRIGVDQYGELRACDDLEHNHVILHCAVWTHIKLPMWGHMSQIRLNVRTSERACAFSRPTTR